MAALGFVLQNVTSEQFIHSWATAVIWMNSTPPVQALVEVGVGRAVTLYRRLERPGGKMPADPQHKR